MPDARDPDPRIEAAADAVQHAAKAMIGAARDVLDALERLVDDPAVADSVVRAVGEWTSGIATAADRLRRSAPPPRPDDDGLEHIEVG